MTGSRPTTRVNNIRFQIGRKFFEEPANSDRLAEALHLRDHPDHRRQHRRRPGDDGRLHLPERHLQLVSRRREARRTEVWRLDHLDRREMELAALSPGTVDVRHRLAGDPLPLLQFRGNGQSRSRYDCLRHLRAGPLAVCLRLFAQLRPALRLRHRRQQSRF